MTIGSAPLSPALASEATKLLSAQTVLHDLIDLRQAGGHLREIDLPVGDEVGTLF